MNKQPRSRGRPVSVGLITAFFLLFLASCVPSLVFYLAGTSSQAAGVAVAAIVIIALGSLGFVRRPNRQQLAIALFIVGVAVYALLLHLLMAGLQVSMELGRGISSLLLFALMIIGGAFLSFSLLEIDDRILKRSIGLMVAVLIFAGFAGVTGLQPPSRSESIKLVFPFTEPSHYALTITPILLCFCALNNQYWRVASLSATLIIAYLLESLSLVVGVAFISAIVLPIRWATVAAVLLIASLGALDVAYFTDRLALNDGSTNLSVLVYIQGWALVVESLERTRGWGIGFQQLGFGPIANHTSNLVARIAGSDSNIRDGGFTLAKVLAELGVLGIVISLAYIGLLVRCGFALRQFATAGMRSSMSAGTVLALSLVCGYAIEVFVRGIGWFSGTAMLFSAAMFFLVRQQSRGPFRRLSRLPSASAPVSKAL